MSIRFETTVDQLVAFNRYHYENSPTWRKQRLIQSCVGPTVMVMVAWVLWQFEGHVPVANFDPVLIVMFFVVVVGTFFFIRWRVTVNLESAVRKLLTEGSNRTILGWCEMALEGNRLVVKRELMEGSFDLRAIQKIITTDDYTFVYVTSVSSIVIPMRLFPEDEYSDFIAELRKAWENRDRPQAADKPDDRIQLAKTT